MAEIAQRIQSFIDLKDEISAFPAVAAVRTARSHVKLAPERHMAVPAFSRFNKDFRAIRKHL